MRYVRESDDCVLLPDLSSRAQIRQLLLLATWQLFLLLSVLTIFRKRREEELLYEATMRLVSSLSSISLERLEHVELTSNRISTRMIVSETFESEVLVDAFSGAHPRYDWNPEMYVCM